MSQTPSQSHLKPTPANGDDLVARLLQGAGHRPEAPTEDAAVIKAAARAEWQKAVKLRQHRAYFIRGTSGLLAAAALIVLLVNTDFWRRNDSNPEGPVAVPDVVATLEATTGLVGALHVSDRLRPGDTLPAGTVLETSTTSDTVARAIVRLRSGPSVRLDTNTRLQFVATTKLQLDRGAVFVDSAPPDSSIEIHTAFGVARNVGTRFEVRVTDHTLRVEVREGTVALHREGQDYVAEAGVGLTVREDGTVGEERLETPCTSSEDWVLGILPVFDAGDGRPLHEALESTAAQGGCELRFADGELAELAAKTVVYGPIHGTTPEERLESLSAVLNAEGLTYRRGGGVFLVEEAASGTPPAPSAQPR